MDDNAFEAGAPKAAQDLKTLKVLVIDGREITRLTLTLLLESRGAEVSGASSQSEALAHLSLRRFDAIVTDDQAAADKFLAQVDSAIVLHNASTQFADGGEFGFGAEIGIATGKFHARGPVGAEQLTSFKYRVHGTGQTRP